MRNKRYSFKDHTGSASITVYEVFPGVQLTYHSIHMAQLHLDTSVKGNLIEIHHCREGRIEQEFDDLFFHLNPGDLSIASKTQMVNAYHFPLGHYHGITIGINMDAAPELLRQMFSEIGVQPMVVTQRLCADKACFILRADKQIERVFSELYPISDDPREGYVKLRILELFLALGGMRADRNQLSDCAMSRTSVKLANRAAAYLSSHMSERITIPELARMLGMSQTHLKTVFKGVYGVPVFSYVRIMKMQAAARALIDTEKPVSVIAEEFGYANTSKFSSAFQAVMGETPGRYRRIHSDLSQET